MVAHLFRVNLRQMPLWLHQLNSELHQEALHQHLRLKAKFWVSKTVNSNLEVEALLRESDHRSLACSKWPHSNRGIPDEAISSNSSLTIRQTSPAKVVHLQQGVEQTILLHLLT